MLMQAKYRPDTTYCMKKINVIVVVFVPTAKLRNRKKYFNDVLRWVYFVGIRYGRLGPILMCYID